MKNFAREWVDPTFQFTLLLFFVIVHISAILGIVIGLSVRNWVVGVSVGVSFIVFCYTFLTLTWYASKRYENKRNFLVFYINYKLLDTIGIGHIILMLN